MKPIRSIITLAVLSIGIALAACSGKNNQNNNNAVDNSNTSTNNTKSILNIDLGADVATLDPQMAEDVQSARIAYDLFEGLVSQNQSNQPIPGLAEKWDISTDGKTYTFHLRPNLKFSDGSALTLDDVVYSYQRLADPNTASPYNFLVANIVNGEAILQSKLPPSQLGIKAIEPNTIEINLVEPDPTFLAIASQPDLAVVSKANISKFGSAWTEPKNMVTSGAYKFDERVVHGHILLSKNPYYYAASDVAISQVKFLPIVDANAALSQYRTGGIDMVYMLPVDQYKIIKAEIPDQEYTVLWEASSYYDFNMTSPKFKNNIKLRQALSMAVDRSTLVKEVLGQNQQPLYSYATATIEGGKFAALNYEWASWPRDKQISAAQQLFKEAGYGPDHPLQITISYNTTDGNKKNSLAIASMWQQVFGATSIQVISNNQEWKTFIQARHKANYDIARDVWVADYDSVNSYTNLYECGNPQNNAHSCTPGYDELLKKAHSSDDPELRVKLIRDALTLAMNNYSIIPLYQMTYFRLVNPKVKGYDINNNHLDHVMSKWFRIVP